jgi:hypothetical protein
LASSQRTATRREPASTTAFGRREAKKLGFRARASRPNKYSSKVQQCPRRSARSNEVRTHSARFNNTKRGQCHDFASKGLGVRVPLAPPYFPLSDLFSRLVGDLNSEHLQQQTAAAGLSSWSKLRDATRSNGPGHQLQVDVNSSNH